MHQSRVQRHGAAATLIDEASAEMRPVADQLDRLLALVEEDAEALGCPEAPDAVRAIARRGTGADRQRAAWQQATRRGAGRGAVAGCGRRHAGRRDRGGGLPLLTACGLAAVAETVRGSGR